MNERFKKIPDKNWLRLFNVLSDGLRNPNIIDMLDLPPEEICLAGLKSRCLERRPKELISCTWDLFNNQDLTRWSELLEVTSKCPTCLALFEEVFEDTCQEAKESGIMTPPRYILC